MSAYAWAAVDDSGVHGKLQLETGPTKSRGIVVNIALSVVVPTCNRPQALHQCLESVQTAIERTGRSDIEVIVTDDSGNDDDSHRLVLLQHPQVRWGRGPRRGPASNRNAGVRRSLGAWILFVDDDCIVGPEWIAAFADAIANTPEGKVFEGKTVADRQRERLNEESPVNEAGGYLWSCNMAISRPLFDQLGGFCESFPYATMEDVDLRLRIQGIGERFPFVEAAVVCHPYRASKGLKFQIRHGESYLHLVARHPVLVSQARPWTWLTNAARRTKNLLVDAARCRFRGFFYGVMSLSIIVYYDFVAHLRHHGSRAS
jgi:GT2 family glycosyltransferase